MHRSRFGLVCAVTIVTVMCTISSVHAIQFLKTAIVNFGAGLNTEGALNHQLIPKRVFIKAGGVVNFVISGFHQVAVYEPGIRPEDIDVTLLDVPLIDDPEGRIYLGPDPRDDATSRSRIEAVFFEEPGLYLVICTVRGHFVDDKMFGFVRVLPSRAKSESRR